MSQLSFQFQAIDRRGVRSKGILHAPSRKDAFRQIAASGLRPLKIRERRQHFWQSNRVTMKELSHFTHQFAVLTAARIPIVDGLQSIAAQEPNAHLRAVIDSIATSIAGGNTVIRSLQPHRELFGDVYLETINAAERSGNLVEVLQQLASTLERQYELSRQVRGALMYPICVVIALTLALTFLMIVAVPRFTEMFASRGMDLPLPTQIVIAVSSAVRVYWFLFLGGIVGAGWLVRRAWRDIHWRGRIDGWLHRIPLLGEVLRGLAISRFANVFGICMRSGLGLIDALEMAGKASGRPLLMTDVARMKDQVKHGGRLSDVLTYCTYLPPFTRRMLASGEEAAEMSRMCDIVSRHYDREVGYLTKNVTTVIEPILIAGLAMILLVVALAMFLPMWSMAELMR